MSELPQNGPCAGRAAESRVAFSLARRILSLCALVLIGRFAAVAEQPSPPDGWSAVAAAKYLDYRANWWESWPAAQRDHQTACVSCHTILPYVLSRPKLRAALNEKDLTGPEKSILKNVQKRVSLWQEVQPYYLDAKSGPGKSRESRATESVLNALVLASNAVGEKKLDPLAKSAFDHAWALQLKSGEHAGAWDWQLFRLSPWEASESQYQGATFMALAMAWAPTHYRRDPAIRGNLQLLRSYLKREYASQPLLNRMVLLWASARLPGLLSNQEKRALGDIIVKQQQPDGGWSLSSLGTWQRSDHSPQDKESDGYATGLSTLALKEAQYRQQRNAWLLGRSWLEKHQNQEDGSWRASSLNKKRDPASDVGRFMTDAATGYAVLALAATR